MSILRASGPEKIQRTGDWYSWAFGYQTTEYAYLIVDYQTNQQPNVYVTGSHSLGQIWNVDERTPNHKASTGETGWIEAPGQYEDVNTHLFVAMSDCGVYPGNGGYVGLERPPETPINWTQVSGSVVPNMVITHDDYVHVYAEEWYNGNLWFDYDNVWYGYISGKAWGCAPPLGQKIEFGGEVATPELETCSDMGNGLFGTQANSATVVETQYRNASYEGHTSIEAGFMSDGAQYNVGQWAPEPGKRVYSYHYGGPGWC